MRSIDPQEQEAFVRAVLRAAHLVIAPQPGQRVVTDLPRHLGAPTGVHGLGQPPVARYEVLREITAIVGPGPAASGRHPLDVAALGERSGRPRLPV